MTFYISSKLANHRQVHELAAALKAAGHSHTYDWTAHCGDDPPGEAGLKALAVAETNGVLAADLLVVVLPGGKGTHTELGIALGAGNKQVIICSPDDDPFKSGGDTCAFYWGPGVLRITGEPGDWLAAITAWLRQQQAAAPKPGQARQEPQR